MNKLPNNSIQRPALRAAADAERYADTGRGRVSTEVMDA